MDLYLVRHAPAEPPRGEDAAADAARRLTAEGRRKFRGVCRGLERQGVRLERVLHSPWRRAQETAALLRPLLEGSLVAEPLLARAPTAALLARLAGTSCALVGHQPWLGELLAWLTLGDPDLGRAFAWKKGGVAHLAGEPRPGGMLLVGFHAPGLLRRLHRR